MSYLDTSYLVRLYQDEPGAETVRDLCSRHIVASSVHAKAELPAALHRSLCEGRTRPDGFLSLIAQFQTDSAGGGFQWLPLSDSLLDGMAARFASLPSTAFLRAADALHLACAAAHGFTEIHSNDPHLLAAAPLFGLQGVNVIA
ncbi:MAG: PIN domain-containing protein [Limisphaerales bacterium]